METSNSQPPTTNIQSSVARGRTGCSMLDVGCRMVSLLRRRFFAALFVAFIFSALTASAQSTNLTTGFGPVQITLGANNGPQDVDTGIKVMSVLTLLTLAPRSLLLMTCFTRMVIVLSFVRSALQLQGTPANQIIIGLSLFITYFIMAPVWDNINRDALAPYQAHQITGAAGAGPRVRPHPHFHAQTDAAQGCGVVRLDGEIAADLAGSIAAARGHSRHSSSANCGRRFKWVF